MMKFIKAIDRTIDYPFSVINVNIGIFRETAQILNLSSGSLGKSCLDFCDRFWIIPKPGFRVNDFGGRWRDFFEKLEIWMGQHGDGGDEDSTYSSDGEEISPRSVPQNWGAMIQVETVWV
jgi:hypothetical protein